MYFIDANYDNETVLKHQLVKDNLYSTVLTYNCSVIFTYVVFCTLDTKGYILDLRTSKLTDIDSIEHTQKFTVVPYNLIINCMK